VSILDRLAALPNDMASLPVVRTLVADADPEVSARAARIVSARTGRETRPVVTRYVPAPLPSAAFIEALRGATADVTFRSLGRVRVQLLLDDATVTVATFAQLADAKKFDGLTIHRIVPNFVIQGGSPGADEYDGITTTFMRDELGFTRNARGTFGTSTRGRDTGDGQLYVNLVDNFRLDHDYTVYGRIIEGMSIIDRIQEGDVIESIRINRTNATNRTR
jgi:cyclophilin family peptidyl-prolyl cis-trans isomerase